MTECVTTRTIQEPTRALRRVLADLALALALFWAVAVAVSGGHTRAHAVPLPQIGGEVLHSYAGASSPAVAHLDDSRHVASSLRRAESGRGQALAFLSLAFAVIVASNLAFLRHLRRVYASPRRSVWRRG
jgi:hypothetical protein